MIVLDDLGFAQLGCYGADIATPNIDKLARQGLRYNSFHVTALCSPTRACLLTGRNHHAVGMGFVPEVPMGFPGYNARIPRSAGTLPRVLRDAGYSTFAVGKWHLTPWPGHSFEQWPLGMGFERYYGFLGGRTNHWTPDLVCDNGPIETRVSPEDGYHLTEDLVSQAIRLVQDQQNVTPGKPFFLYFATGATHEPHHVPSAWVEPYRHQFVDGWEAWRHDTFVRQQELGVVPPGTVCTERPSWVSGWDALSPAERRLFGRQMEVYAGFLTHTDAQIGRLLGFLSDLDVLDNTLIMVLSDNGASADGGPHGAFSRMEIDDVEFMLGRIDELGGFRANNHYAWGWAWAGNTPFRLWKRYSWLGGVRTPLVIQWPAGIRAENTGQVGPQFCHAIDLMPTILEAAGVDVPEMLDGVSQQALHGKSLLASFNDLDSPSPRNTQYFETDGTRAIYHNGWKATTDHVDIGMRSVEKELMEGSQDFETDRWLLFHLENDFSEASDLAQEHPDRLCQMVELWWHEAGRNQVLPLTNTEERITAVEPPPYPAPDRYVYLPPGGPIRTPSPFVGGFRLTAEIELPEGNAAAGIICAQGDWHGGWACYLLNSRLTVTFNFGSGPKQIMAAKAIRAGKHQVSIEYVPGKQHDASVSVAVDNQTVGAGPIPAELTMLQRNGSYVGNLLVGRDQGFPVCDDYRPPFPFTGYIRRVVIELNPPPFTNAREDIANVLRCD